MAKNLLQYKKVCDRNAFFKEKGSALILFDRANRRYFSGVDIAEGVLIVSRASAYFTDDRYYYAATEKLKDTHFSSLRFTGIQAVKNFLKSNGIKKAYTDLSKITVGDYNAYKSFGIKLLDGTKYINSATAVKTQAELKNIEKACSITQNAFYKTLERVKTGITENKLKSILEKNMLMLGADGFAFDTIVAFGANSAVPHHETGDEKLKNDSVVLMDFGATYQGFSADMTRTFFVGEPSEKFIAHYDSVKYANERVENTITENFRAKDAHCIAVAELAKTGIEKHFTHSLGRGLGLEIHGAPRLSTKSDEILREGTTFTVEPGVYFDGEYGIRIEDTVVLTKDGIKRLFTDSKELIVIK